jgi:hypothetical protein
MRLDFSVMLRELTSEATRAAMLREVLQYGWASAAGVRQPW